MLYLDKRENHSLTLSNKQALQGSNNWLDWYGLDIVR